MDASAIGKDLTMDFEHLNKRALLIINPVAGKRAVLKHLDSILNQLTEDGYLVTAMVTQQRGDTRRITENLGNRFDLVLCTGGDGSLHEMVCGIASSGLKTNVGYLPCGSSNDFATFTGLPLDLTQAAHVAATGSPESYDIGTFGEDHFLYIAAFGAFSYTSYDTDQTLKNILGFPAYILSGIKDLSKVHPIPMRFTDEEGVHEGSYLFGCVANSLYLQRMIPDVDLHVDLSDGIFEVLLIQYPDSLIELREIAHSLITGEFSHQKIDFFHTKGISIDNPECVPWSLEGERSGSYQTFRIDPIRNGLTLIR